MAERRWEVPLDVAREARRLAHAATGVDAARLRDLGSRMPVGRATLLALLAAGVNGHVGGWAQRLYSSSVDVERDAEIRVLTAAGIESPCLDACYGIVDGDVVHAVIRAGADATERWGRDGWQPVEPDLEPTGLNVMELAGDLLTDALDATGSGHGLLLRATTPKAFLPKRISLTASACASDGVYAAVDEVDTTAVLDVLRVADGTVWTRDAGEWVPGVDTVTHLLASGVPLALLPDADVGPTLRQVDDYDAVFPIVAADVLPDDGNTDTAGQGDEQNPSPTVAGLAVHAPDTGRVLMLQRALTDDDPAAGDWEFPGGHLEDGEKPFNGAMREWQEETGCQLPDGELRGMWTSPDGVYQGHVYELANGEDDVPIHDGRDDVTNPDDPDGDQIEALAWWEPSDLAGNPGLRPELAAQVPDVLSALEENDPVNVTADVVPDDGVSADDTVTPQDSTPDFSDGVMIALPLDDDTAQQLAVPGGLDPAEMHVTLAYLGTQGDVPLDMDGLAELVAQWAEQQQPLSGEVSGPATFEGTDNAGNPVQVALADVPGLPEARQSLLDHLAGNGIEQQSEHSFTPHVTRAYSADPVPTDGLGGTPLQFGQVGVWHGNDQQNIPLGPVTAAFNPSEKRDPTGKWTSGGGSAAQNQALEANRKTTAPHAAPTAKTVVTKPYTTPGGGGGGGGKGGSAASKKAAAAKKAAAKAAAVAKKTALRKTVAAQEKAERDAETAQHQAFTQARAAEGLAEQQRRIAFMKAYARTPKKQRPAMMAREQQRRLAWQTGRATSQAAENTRHQAAVKKITADKAKLDAKLTADLAAIDAAIAKEFPPTGTPAPAKAPAKKAPPKAPVKASAEPVVADAVAHTRTPRQLEEYWVHGPGAAKIRWGESRDWYRCVAQLAKYVHNEHTVKGQCNSLHKIATGMWPATHDKLLHGGK